MGTRWLTQHPRAHTRIYTPDTRAHTGLSSSLTEGETNGTSLLSQHTLVSASSRTARTPLSADAPDFFSLLRSPSSLLTSHFPSVVTAVPWGLTSTSLVRSAVYVQSVHQVFDIDFYIFYFQEFSFWKKKIKYAGHVSFLLPTHVSSLTFRDTPSIIYISYLIVLIPEIFKDVCFFLWTLARGDWFLCAVCVWVWERQAETEGGTENACVSSFFKCFGTQPLSLFWALGYRVHSPWEGLPSLLQDTCEISVYFKLKLFPMLQIM